MDYVGLSSGETLRALSALLSSTQDDEEEEEDCGKVTPSAQLGPGQIGPPPQKHKEELSASTEKNSKDIWNEEEVAEGSPFIDFADPRPQPEYEIILKQSVGTEDVFFGLSRKDPSSMCCEALLVKIKLPDTRATDVILDVKEKFLDLRTQKHKLGLHLPHPVHAEDSRAQFFSEREELQVTLLIKRSMDFFNKQ
ncbi:protein PIH1D3 [Oryzias melastigma]|uniref:Dynein axonemal assembly factor 6 n=1 Tax=Oryzias melastigma TaxID=30732 RepID=A0A3B3E260_ORYME|nr:protein PIH1D3 [Oryzias melastigma]